MRKPFFRKSLLIFVFTLLLLTGTITWVNHSGTPYFFPLDNPQGKYWITRNCPEGQGWQKKYEGKGKAYCVEYEGQGVFMNKDNGNANFFRVTVGNSKLDLAPFDGKRVKNIEGGFTDSSQQCIQYRCTSLFEPLVVLNIDNLELDDK